MVIPTDERVGLAIDDAELHRQQHAIVDHRTDELFAPLNPSITTLIAPVSRLVVDVERFRADIDEPASKHGMGAVYTHGINHVPLRPKLSTAERERLLKAWYDPHHAKLNREVERQCTTGSHTCILIDAHSYPLSALPTELTTASRRPQICIGTDQDWSRGITDVIVAHFEAAGYDVALDTPYAGSLVPSIVSTSSPNPLYQGFRTVMIEVRRDVYLDGDNQPNREFKRLQLSLNTLYERLLQADLDV
jgi:N-formylglutamate amidohydrolase